MSKFQYFPDLPHSESLRNAYTILSGAHDTASSFLDIFEKTRDMRKAKGAPTDEEQDLLRAMLIFACAGLDSMVKQLVRDALALVIQRSEGAHGNFKLFIEKRLARQGILDPRFLAEVLSSKDPRDVLVTELVNELTSQSLQSKDQVLRAASFFDIPSNTLAPDLKLLGRIFQARNQIAHEMDVDFDQPNRNRRPRRKAEMITHTTEILRLANTFLVQVDNTLMDKAI